MKYLSTMTLAALFALGASAQNPYLPLWEHLPDGEPRVFDDPDNPGHQRAYIIGSHDVTYTGYCGPDVRMWSAPVENLTDWRDEGSIFTYYVDGQWDTMFAPDLVEVPETATVDGKTVTRKAYYLYPHSRGWQRVPMVCKGYRPDGPFVPVNISEDGRKCTEGSMIDFDPSVFVEPVTNKKDPDYGTGYRAYVFYGFQHSTAAELDQQTMYSVRPGTQLHDYFIPASYRYGEVRDPQGTTYPALYKGQNPGEFNFFEASSIRQVGNKYVMVFSGFSGPDYGLGSTNSALRYAYGDSPLGPWRSGGVLVDSRGVVPNEDGSHLTTSNAAHNTHGSLQQINGQWYVFYHRPPRGYGYARQPMVAPVKITWDKRKVADGGQVRITAYDPFARNEEWTATAADGCVYTGAEVTSEGFQVYGLPPYGYYSAGIAAYMSGYNWLQDNYDQWDDNMDLCGITNGGIIGYKYFGFGGLATGQKGLSPFAGTKKGDDATLCLNLTPGGKGAFSIHVMLDGPYANSTWGGREIGCINVPAEAPSRPTQYKVALPAVEGLQGKHAIYLVAEGPEVKADDAQRNGFRQNRDRDQRPKGLFDLHGLGFTRDGADLNVPSVPEVTILVDGRPLVMSHTPIFSTNQNGYTEVNRYQIYGRLTDTSKISVRSSDPAVTYTVSPISAGRATVTCTYKGRDKVFLIN